VRPGGLEPPAS